MGRTLRTGLRDYGQGRAVPDVWPLPGTLPDGLAAFAAQQPSASAAKGVKRRWSTAHTGGSGQVRSTRASLAQHHPPFPSGAGLYIGAPICPFALLRCTRRPPCIFTAGPSREASLATRPAACQAAS